VNLISLLDPNILNVTFVEVFQRGIFVRIRSGFMWLQRILSLIDFFQTKKLGWSHLGFLEFKLGGARLGNFKVYVLICVLTMRF